MTMFERMTQLFIPLINEVFGTNYTEDEKILKLRDEHHFSKNKIITDAYIGIRDSRYHFECQSVDDDNMIIRMFEYDTVIALEAREYIDGVLEIKYPKACVVYLRGKDVKKRKDIMRVRFQDGFVYEYRPEVIEVSAYSLDDLFKKKLLLFLPFYLIRYETATKINDMENPEYLRFFKDTKEMIDRVSEINNEGTQELCINLIDLTKRITDYICRSSKSARERMDDIMSGKVLKLKSDLLREEGEAIGEVRGRAEGETKALAGLVQDGIIDIKTAAKRLGVSVKKFKEMAAAQSVVL